MSESAGNNMAFDWVPGAVLGVAGSAIAWWRSTGIAEALVKERIEQIKQEMAKGTQLSAKVDDDFKEELCAAINELRAVTLTMAKMSSGQDVLNTVTQKALESLTRKSEANEKAISELQATTSLIRQWLERQNKG